VRNSDVAADVVAVVDLTTFVTLPTVDLLETSGDELPDECFRKWAVDREMQ
jgi:hypothetical protein